MAQEDVTSASDKERRNLVLNGYIAQLMSSHMPALRAAFGTAGLLEPQEDIVLRRRLASTLGMLDVAATLGRQLVYVQEGDTPTQHDPAIDMGWLERSRAVGSLPDTAERTRYGIEATNEGVMVLDGLRAAMGQPTTEEMLESNLKSYQQQAAELVERRTSFPGDF
jgi:hypothetical protein